MVGLTSALLTLVLSGNGDTVLLDFYGDWCAACRAMAPVLDQFAAKGYPVRKVNIDREPDLKARFQVSGVPCFVMLVEGREVDRVVGSTNPARLEQMFALARNQHPVARPETRAPIQFVSEGAAAPAIPIPATTSGAAFTESSQPGTNAASGDRQTAQAPGWRIAAPEGTPGEEAKSPASADLIAVTVRLRVEDPSGHSVGSGTIVDARGDYALILTCAHLFRSSKGQGRIEVNLFGPTPAERIPGELKHFDLDRDLGLVSIRIPGPIHVARIAPPNHPITRGAKVFSCGCSHGDPPTMKSSTVTAINKFLGSPNIEASGLPAQARSGGGLFSADGYVIGVCNAAVPEDNEGLYAALAAIHTELDTARCSFAYRDSTPIASTAVASNGPPTMAKQMPAPNSTLQPTDMPQPGPVNRSLPPARSTLQDRSAAADPIARPDRSPPQDPQAAGSPRQDPNAAGSPPSGRGLSEDEQAALEEIRRRRAEGAEVICVIRPLNNPRAESEIITIKRASPEFVEQVTARSDGTPDWRPRWLQRDYRGE